MCMFVCMYVNIHVCMFVCTHTSIMHADVTHTDISYVSSGHTDITHTHTHTDIAHKANCRYCGTAS